MKLDEIWIERKDLLDKLQMDVRDLVKLNVPGYRKVSYWEAIYANFAISILEQDRKIDKRLR